ncbi:hypothetical protein AAVH_29847 [Aphelenchoides avenae]|nr:hypothetical protein AAVH_29847 [Aphelenchus avenae]
MYKDECRERALYGEYQLSMTAAFYVINNTRGYLRSTASYLEDIAIIQVDDTKRFNRSDIRPACVPTGNDRFHQENAFSFALVQSQGDTLMAGKYAKQPVVFSNATESNSDKWHKLACNTTGIKCVKIPYRSKKKDFWILPGVGVFDKVVGSDKDWHLYGYVLEIVPDDKHQHYHVVIRVLQGLLKTLCYHTGACSDVDLAAPLKPGTLEVRLNVKYKPNLHNGTHIWRLPNGTSYDDNTADNFDGRFYNDTNNGFRKHYHQLEEHHGKTDHIDLYNTSNDHNIFFYKDDNKGYHNSCATPKHDGSSDNRKYHCFVDNGYADHDRLHKCRYCKHQIGNLDKCVNHNPRRHSTNVGKDVDDALNNDCTDQHRSHDDGSNVEAFNFAINIDCAVHDPRNHGRNVDKDVYVAVVKYYVDNHRRHHDNNVDKNTNIALDNVCANHYRRHHDGNVDKDFNVVFSND